MEFGFQALRLNQLRSNDLFAKSLKLLTNEVINKSFHILNSHKPNLVHSTQVEIVQNRINDLSPNTGCHRFKVHFYGSTQIQKAHLIVNPIFQSSIVIGIRQKQSQQSYQVSVHSVHINVCVDDDDPMWYNDLTTTAMLGISQASHSLFEQ